MKRGRALGLMIGLLMPALAGADEEPLGAPPETRFVRTPARVTTQRLAEFEFESDVAGASFECSLDGHGFFKCHSPLRLHARIHLGQRHTLEVRALARDQVDPTPASHTWRPLLELPWHPLITQPMPGDFVEQGPLRVVGMARPGSAMRVLLNDQPVASTQADRGGVWALTLNVEEGRHTLQAEMEDEVGEAIAPTPPVRFDVLRGVGGCSAVAAGGSPTLFLIGLLALTISASVRQCG
jgi:hypothetical protein